MSSEEIKNDIYVNNRVKDVTDSKLFVLEIFSKELINSK